MCKPITLSQYRSIEIGSGRIFWIWFPSAKLVVHYKRVRLKTLEKRRKASFPLEANFPKRNLPPELGTGERREEGGRSKKPDVEINPNQWIHREYAGMNLAAIKKKTWDLHFPPSPLPNHPFDARYSRIADNSFSSLQLTAHLHIYFFARFASVRVEIVFNRCDAKTVADDASCSLCSSAICEGTRACQPPRPFGSRSDDPPDW